MGPGLFRSTTSTYCISKRLSFTKRKKKFIELARVTESHFLADTLKNTITKKFSESAPEFKSYWCESSFVAICENYDKYELNFPDIIEALVCWIGFTTYSEYWQKHQRPSNLEETGTDFPLKEFFSGLGMEEKYIELFCNELSYYGAFLDREAGWKFEPKVKSFGRRVLDEWCWMEDELEI